MAPLRSVLVIEAPLPAVAAALRDPGVLRGVYTGLSLPPAGLLLAAGDELRLWPGAGRRTPRRGGRAVGPGLHVRVDTVRADRVQRTVRTGPLDLLVHTSALRRDGAAGLRSVLTDTVTWALPGTPGRSTARLLGGRIGALLTEHADRVAARARQLASAPRVVAAALIDTATGPDGTRTARVLAQQRAYPRPVAGRWELPGGRVEAGETPQEALVRECREELAIEVVPGPRLGPDIPLRGGAVLQVHTARLADRAARPVPVEHHALRWVGAADLAALDWLDTDRVVLPDLAAALTARRPPARPGYR